MSDLPSPPDDAGAGSVLFTYTQADPAIDRAEAGKAVTTSLAEVAGGASALARRVATDPRARQRLMRHYAMYVVADLGDEHATAGSAEKVLVEIRAHPDGSFDMRPGFSEGGAKYRRVCCFFFLLLFYPTPSCSL